MDNRLPAEMRGEFTRCCICGEYVRAIHWHHTIPRSLGGTDSLQVPLDGDCHTNLHAKAEAVVAALRKHKPKSMGRFWSDPDIEQRAETWLRILVDAMLFPPVDERDLHVLLPAISVDKQLRFELDVLKRDLPGITNLRQVLEYCIIYTLRAKGIRNEPEVKREGTGKRRNVLW